MKKSNKNKIKFTSKKYRGWLDVGGTRMCLLDISGGWYNFVSYIELYSGEETSHRILFEAGLAETFSRNALEQGILENTEKGFRDALDTYSEGGFGNFHIQEMDFKKGYAKIACQDSFEAWAFLANKRPPDHSVCYYSTGVLLSFMKNISEIHDLVAAEVKCIAKGDEICEFIIGQEQVLRKNGAIIPTWGLSIKEKSERLEELLKEKNKIERELVRKNLELSILNRISATLNQTLELNRILALAVDELSKIFRNKGIGIYLVDRRNNELVFSAQKGFPDDFFRSVSRLKLGQGISGEVAELQIPLAYDDYSQYPRKLKSAIKQAKIKSVLSVPLMAQNKVVGVLNIASRVPYHFSSEEISLMTLVGNQIGTAIANALLHEEIKESEEKYKTLVEDINDGYILCQDGKIIFANNAFLTMHGYSPEIVLGQELTNFLSSECAKQVESICSFTNQYMQLPEHLEFLRTHRDGRKLPTELKINFVEFNGKPALVAIFRDVSEKKRMEQELLENERLATIGQVAADIAHEIRNPLSAIKMNIQILSKKLSLDGFNEKRFKIAEGEIIRLEKIVNEVLNSARPLTLETQPKDVGEIIESSLSLLNDKLQENNIGIEVKIPKNCPKILVDVHKLQQALLNVIINAIDAMPQGGKIRVLVRKTKRGGRKMLSIGIADNGQGIDPHHLKKIFDPFFSTKDKGIGLGLSNVKNIIEAHGGIVEVESKPHSGAHFKILLPLEDNGQ